VTQGLLYHREYRFWSLLNTADETDFADGLGPGFPDSRALFCPDSLVLFRTQQNPKA
jgi:hypothetical protein